MNQQHILHFIVDTTLALNEELDILEENLDKEKRNIDDESLMLYMRHKITHHLDKLDKMAAIIDSMREFNNTKDESTESSILEELKELGYQE